MFFPQFTAANTKSITRNRSDKPISGCPLAPLDQIHKKAQDRDGGEEIASNSVLKIRMKNAVLRSRQRLVRSLLRSGRTAELQRLMLDFFPACTESNGY
jgi:hypothetical protein